MRGFRVSVRDRDVYQPNQTKYQALTSACSKGVQISFLQTRCAKRGAVLHCRNKPNNASRRRGGGSRNTLTVRDAKIGRRHDEEQARRETQINTQ